MFEGIQAIFQSILEDSEGVIWFYFNKKWVYSSLYSLVQIERKGIVW